MSILFINASPNKDGNTAKGMITDRSQAKKISVE